jgi:hypothetical protein
MGGRGDQQPRPAGPDRHDLTGRCRRVSLRQVNQVHAQALLARMHGTLGGFYAGTTGDVAVRQLFTPEVAWHVPGHNPIAGDYLGVDEVLDYLRRRAAHGLHAYFSRACCPVGVMVNCQRPASGLPASIHQW